MFSISSDMPEDERTTNWTLHCKIYIVVYCLLWLFLSLFTNFKKNYNNNKKGSQTVRVAVQLTIAGVSALWLKGMS